MISKKHFDTFTNIEYGFQETPFGKCLLAFVENNILSLHFINNTSERESISELQIEWPTSNLHLNSQRTKNLIDAIFENFGNSDNVDTSINHRNTNVSCVLHGTEFQKKVWNALTKIPYATTVTYSDAANMINMPKAVRAVASCIAKNKISLLIPCHRVVRKSGEIGQYRWGVDVKKKIIEWEKQTS